MKILFLFISIFMILEGGLLAAGSPLGHNNYKQLSRGSELTRSDYKLLEKFEEFEVRPSSFSLEKLTYEIFEDKARAKVLGSFNYTGKSPEVYREFRAQFSSNRYNYDYDLHPKTVSSFGQERDLDEYELKKAFAMHTAKKLGDYHFNKWIKYHPKISNVVKKVENINVEIKVASPSKPGGKPTKIKLKINPFKTELKLNYSSSYLEGNAKYHVVNGDLNFDFSKPTPFVDINLGYNFGKVGYMGLMLDRSYSLGFGRKVYKDVTAVLSFHGKENVGDRHVDSPNKVFLNFTVPL